MVYFSPQNEFDLNEMLNESKRFDSSGKASFFEALRGKHLLITGGTGFFGSWLLDSIFYLNRELGLQTTATVLSRNPSAFKAKAPYLFGPESAFSFIQADVTTLNPSELAQKVNRPVFGIIHAATDARASFNEKEPLAMADSVLLGTRNLLELARLLEATNFLFTSTGAVYGPQPPKVTHVAETFGGGPDPLVPYSSYAEAKRMAEFFCGAAARASNLQVKIARCFAFVGPRLPLDEHFAIGNFIRDVGFKKPIHIGGDGTPLRSYLYASDLCLWLWRILLNGKSLRPYNVGSEDAISISALAQTIATTLAPDTPILVAKPRAKDDLTPIAQYVPSTQRAQQELGLRQTVSLAEAIRRTYAYNFKPETASL